MNATTQITSRAILKVREEFERAWVTQFKVYRPLLGDDEPKLVARVSAMKGLAWNLYLQGRTDEMERTLLGSMATALLRKGAR